MRRTVHLLPEADYSTFTIRGISSMHQDPTVGTRNIKHDQLICSLGTLTSPKLFFYTWILIKLMTIDELDVLPPSYSSGRQTLVTFPGVGRYRRSRRAGLCWPFAVVDQASHDVRIGMKGSSLGPLAPCWFKSTVTKQCLIAWRGALPLEFSF